MVIIGIKSESEILPGRPVLVSVKILCILPYPPAGYLGAKVSYPKMKMRCIALEYYIALHLESLN